MRPQPKNKTSKRWRDAALKRAEAKTKAKVATLRDIIAQLDLILKVD